MFSLPINLFSKPGNYIRDLGENGLERKQSNSICVNILRLSYISCVVVF